MEVEKEILSGGVGGWDNEVLEKSFKFFVIISYNLVPVGPLALNDIVEVVEYLSCLWELEVTASK